MKTETNNLDNRRIKKDNKNEHRQALRDLQESSSNSEAFAGRPMVSKLTKTKRIVYTKPYDPENIENKIIGESHKKCGVKLDSENTNKIIPKIDKGVQYGELNVSPDELTAKEQSVDYWILLSKTYEKSLKNTELKKQKLLEKNDVLKKQNKMLKEELAQTKKLLEEAKCFIEVIEELLQD